MAAGKREAVGRFSCFRPAARAYLLVAMIFPRHNRYHIRIRRLGDFGLRGNRKFEAGRTVSELDEAHISVLIRFYDPITHRHDILATLPAAPPNRVPLYCSTTLIGDMCFWTLESLRQHRVTSLWLHTLSTYREQIVMRSRQSIRLALIWPGPPPRRAIRTSFSPPRMLLSDPIGAAPAWRVLSCQYHILSCCSADCTCNHSAATAPRY